MYAVRNSDISDNRLSDKNTLEVKSLDTQLVVICNTFNYEPKISTEPQNADF